MNRLSTFAIILFSGIGLSACSNTGTTYGTGTSHEEATLKSLSSLFELRPNKKTKINYSPRPELIMPANKNALPAPVDDQNTNSENWPVSPEQRQAEVRADAPTTDSLRKRTSSDLPVEFALSEKEGIGKEKRANSAANRARFNENSYNSILREIEQGKDKKLSAEVLARKEQLEYTSGSAPRRFLTEPPVEYRTPAATADAGDQGIDEAVLEERQKAAREANRNIDRGITQGAIE